MPREPDFGEMAVALALAAQREAAGAGEIERMALLDPDSPTGRLAVRCLPEVRAQVEAVAAAHRLLRDLVRLGLEDEVLALAAGRAGHAEPLVILAGAEQGEPARA